MSRLRLHLCVLGLVINTGDSLTWFLHHLFLSLNCGGLETCSLMEYCQIACRPKSTWSLCLKSQEELQK